MKKFPLHLEIEEMPTPWDRVWATLCKLHLQIPEPQVEYVLDWKDYPHPFLYGSGLDDLEGRYGEDADIAVELLVQSGKAEVSEAEILLLVSLRAKTAMYFVMQMLNPGDIEDSRTTIIPFPNLPEIQVIRWFLLDWWKHNGRRAAGRQKVLEEMESAFDKSIQKLKEK
jgi:hypothetical protein